MQPWRCTLWLGVGILAGCVYMQLTNTRYFMQLAPYILWPLAILLDDVLQVLMICITSISAGRVDLVYIIWGVVGTLLPLHLHLIHVPLYTSPDMIAYAGCLHLFPTYVLLTLHAYMTTDIPWYIYVTTVANHAHVSMYTLLLKPTRKAWTVGVCILYAFIGMATVVQWDVTTKVWRAHRTYLSDLANLHTCSDVYVAIMLPLMYTLLVTRVWHTWILRHSPIIKLLGLGVIVAAGHMLSGAVAMYCVIDTILVAVEMHEA